MKSLLKYFFCTVLICVYVFSYMGFGLHECKCEGTKDLILMLGDTSCEAIHSHTHSHIHTGCEHPHSHPHTVGCHHGEEGCSCCDDHISEHGGNCCDTSIYVVSADQDGGKNSVANVTVPVYTLEHSFFSIHNYSSDLTAELYYDADPPLILYGEDALSSISVWRL